MHLAIRTFSFQTVWLFVLGSCLQSPALSQEPNERTAAPSWQERPWNRDLIYFVMTDRFLDGDPANNRPAGSDPTLYDPSQTELKRYHGGDFRGLELAIRDGYFDALGVTTIWITPPVRNAWSSSADVDSPNAGYHGYWAQDFLDVDPHLTSRTSLAGTPYSDDRDGRIQHYKDLVTLAHQHNIKIVQDVVCNHIGPLFFYDTNSNGVFDTAEGYEWIVPFKDDGFYSTAKWADIPKWNLLPAQPAGPMTILGRSLPTTGVFQQLNVYGRKGYSAGSLGKSDGEEVSCDFFTLRDFWTDPDSPHFDRLVDEFVEIYAFYIDFVGVDGMRIDTVKHAHHEFWDALTERLRAKLGNQRASRLLMFGEVYDGNPSSLGKYTYRSDFPNRTDPCLDSLLNFQFCFNVRDYLRVKDQPFGSARGLQQTIDAMNASGENGFYNPNPGADGLSSRQKMVNFAGNHDGINRFLVEGVSPAANTLAMAITLTFEGVPCIYYGTEVPLQDEQGRVGRESETGRMTFCVGGNADTLQSARATDAFSIIKSLSDLRQELPALHSGRMNTLWVDAEESDADDGIFAFARYIETDTGIQTSETVIVVVNANPRSSATTTNNDSAMRLFSHRDQPLVQAGQRLREIDLASGGVAEPIAIEWIDDQPHVRLTVPAQSVRLYRVE